MTVGMASITENTGSEKAKPDLKLIESGQLQTVDI